MMPKWKAWRANLASVLSMNRRNLHYIYPNNSRPDYPLADNKLLTKDLLKEAGLPVAKTYRVYKYFHEVSQLQQDLAGFENFVVKPANGRGGGGIKVIAGRQNPPLASEWLGLNDEVISVDSIRKQVLDIIFGIYSFDTHDVAIVEEKVIQHHLIDHIFDSGLSDARIIMCRHNPIMAMIRIPTRLSDGRANLHQGAIGAGIDIETGITQHAIFKGETLLRHPDSDKQLAGISIPYWQNTMQICQQVARLMPLKYLGIDIAITQNGPVILEVNVRPGIEIQNANQAGLRAALEAYEIAGKRHE